MRIALCLGIGLGIILLGFAAQPLRGDQTPPAQLKSDPAPTLRASDLLPRESLKGHNFEIAEFVPVQDQKYLFTIKSDGLEFKILGRNLLEWRLRELHAWQRARGWEQNRNVERLPLSQSATIQPVKHSQLTLKSYVSNPRGRSLQPIRIAEDTSPLPILPPDARAGSLQQRKLACDLGCDPETFHPQLHTLLESLAREPQSLPGDELVRATPLPPSHGWLNLPSDQKALLVNKAPHEILQSIDEELAELQVPADIRHNFCHQLDLTTYQKLLFVTHFRGLQQVSGSRELFSQVIQARDEVEALDRLQELGLAQESHRREPLKAITWHKSGVQLETQSGSQILVVAADYLTAESDLTNQLQQFRTQHPKANLALYTTARLSPTTRKSLDRHKIKIQDR